MRHVTGFWQFVVVLVFVAVLYAVGYCTLQLLYLIGFLYKIYTYQL